MRGALGAVVLGVFAATAACDSKAPKTSAAVAPTPVGDPREEAARLATRGDYAGAERKYREALTAQPEDVELRFGLGSVLTQLDRRAEAVEQFRWVVEHGRRGQPEVDSARRWLADAGEIAPLAPVAATTPAEAPPSGGLTGRLTWPGLPPEKHFGIRIIVTPQGEGGARKIVRSKLNGTYKVDGLPDGQYTVTGLAGPMRVWSDLPVTVRGGQATTFDLTPANARVSTNEFPVRASPR